MNNVLYLPKFKHRIMKRLPFLFVFILSVGYSSAQFTKYYELNAGIVAQKTQKLYWENGIGVDFASDFLLDRRIHLKAAMVSSRLGSAFRSNAISQESFTLGADWRFFRKKPMQIFTGLNAGYFMAHYDNSEFDILPNSSSLLQFESGMSYRFAVPLTLSASLGYNFINSNGKKGPGTLFPVFYQLKVYYRIK